MFKFTRFRIDFVIGIVTTLLVSVLYLFTIAPTLSWGWREIAVDGGDLLAAAHSMGIPHPSGYPTFMLLLKGFSIICPWGDLAFRGNLLSASLGVTSAALLYWFVYRISLRLDPGIPPLLRALAASFSALTFATAPLVWSQSVITEVYSLNAAFVGLLFVESVFLTQSGRKSRGLLVGTGLTIGLGLGNHLSLLAIVLPLAAWVIYQRRLRFSSVCILCIGLLIGLSVYIYIPIRAASNPVINWGDAETFKNFYWLVSGKAYQEYILGIPFNSIGWKIISWLELIFQQLNPLGIFLAAAGISVLMRFQRPFLIATGISALGLLVYSMTYNTFDSYVLAIPAIFVIAVYAGLGLNRITTIWLSWVHENKDGLNSIQVKRKALIGVLIGIAFLAVPFVAVMLNYDSQDRSDDKRALEYAERVLEAIPNGAVVVSDTEDRLFSLWYYGLTKYGDKETIQISSRLLRFDWYWHNLAERHPLLFPEDVPSNVGQALLRIVDSAAPSPGVYFTFLHPVISDNFELTSDVPGLYAATPR